MTTSDKTLYQAAATAAGGHPGTVRTADGVVQARLATPPELGGRGDAGTNAEQLLAAAYAACFYSALEQVAAQDGVALPAGLSVTSQVRLSRADAGWRLAVEVGVEGGQGAGDRLQELVAKAEAVWPHAPGVAPQVQVHALAAA